MGKETEDARRERSLSAGLYASQTQPSLILDDIGLAQPRTRKKPILSLVFPPPFPLLLPSAYDLIPR